MTTQSQTVTDPWQAPSVSSPIQATIEIPGSKSLTNRYFILAALSEGKTTVKGALISRDTELMIAALQTLGYTVEANTAEPTTFTIEKTSEPSGGGIDCGLAGTVMRFIPPLVALQRGTFNIDGDEAARVRPMGPVIQGLKDLGVEIKAKDPNFLPFEITGTGQVIGGKINVDASASSQFISGLLLCAAKFEKGLELHHVGATLPSQPHIDMTVEVLRSCGVQVADSTPGVWVVSPGPIKLPDLVVEPDLSNAGVFLAAALATSGSVAIKNWPSVTTQPGGKLPRILQQMGASTTLVDGLLTVSHKGPIKPLNADLSEVGELTPVLAALATLADGPSHLYGVAHLRGHETDRLAALATEIARAGSEVEETEDGLKINPKPLQSAQYATYDDHRMAHFAAVLSLVQENSLIENIQTTSKTMPGFVTLWQDMIAQSK